ncbi:hypothetical protein BU25DRAFT_425345 [Macroventuria anomochaeta]|uniref:Uncharacterized protein n=1 Tax=Macroventuria anomochaeta TaxID=301207 RepID=A0ACB6RM53_9PLEO|nr:uncharacterized protein BU25DRAFT_425345 [Macroventuria anomochaeta]KAF2622864.1 hypothetical protein BU25DRAFT_425345 [Macroventuria anomochaeta]
MASKSKSNLINDNPIDSGLDLFRGLFRSTQTELEILSLSEAVLYIVKNTFQNFPASNQLPSKFQNATLLNDINRFTPSITSKAYDIQRTVILCDRVVRCAPDEEIWDALYDLVTESTPPPCPPSSILQSPWLRNTSGFANLNEHCRYMFRAYKGIACMLDILWDYNVDNPTRQDQYRTHKDVLEFFTMPRPLWK